MSKIKRIHVNMHHIRYNNKHEDKKPVITCKTGGKNIYGNTVKIFGPSEVKYSPDKPLSCGAKVWVETTSEVIIT